MNAMLRLRCPDCPYERTEFDMATLTEHYANVHLGGFWLYKCPRCQIRFATPYLAAHHMSACWDVTAQMHQYTQPLVTYDFTDHQTIKKALDKALLDAIDLRIREEGGRKTAGSGSTAHLTQTPMTGISEGFYNLDDQHNNNINSSYNQYDPMSLDNISPENSRNLSNWGDRIVTEPTVRQSRESFYSDVPERRTSLENFGYVDDRSPRAKREMTNRIIRSPPGRAEIDGRRRSIERERRRDSRSPRIIRRAVSPRIRRAASPRIRRIASPRVRRTEERRRSKERERSRDRRVRSPLRRFPRGRRSESRDRARRADNRQLYNTTLPHTIPSRNAPIPSLMDLDLNESQRGSAEGYPPIHYTGSLISVEQQPTRADDYLQPSVPIGEGIAKLTGPMSTRNMMLYNEKTDKTDIIIELESNRSTIMHFNSQILSDASPYFKRLLEAPEFLESSDRKLVLNRPYVPFLDAMNIVHERKVPWKSRCKSYFCCWNLHRVHKVMKEGIELELTCVKAYVHRELFLNRCQILNEVSDCTGCIERVALAKFFNLNNVKFTPMACLKWITDCGERSCAVELNVTAEVTQFIKKFLAASHIPGFADTSLQQ